MRQLLHLGEILAMNAYLSPDKVGARDNVVWVDPDHDLETTDLQES